MSRRVLVFILLAGAAPALFAQEASEAKRGLAALSVPSGFTVEVAAGPELSAYPIFMAFDHQGLLFVAESSGRDRKSKEQVADPDFSILTLEDENGDGVFDKRTVFADKLGFPMGVLCHQGSVYVAAPPEFLRLQDADGDGVAEVREVILSGWNFLNTASLHGPFLGPDGWLYLTHGRHGYEITTKEGETLKGQAARVWRCLPDGTRLERVAGGGFDNPVEIAFTDAGEMLGTMTYFTDPRNGQRDALMHWVDGGVYPKPGDVVSEFIRTGDLMPTMTKFARIAPSGLALYRGKAFGKNYRGNLFSAQFNPHRVQRHRLVRSGATFSTTDEDFLSSADPDFHPTDVLEDADGSLLVSDTGAWYVDACPISRVAKPELRGGIYRVRKKNAPAQDDPWGRKLGIEQRAPGELTPLLADARPPLRDYAAELLVAQGVVAIPELIKTLREGAETARVAAVWILGRIGTPEALAAVRGALDADLPEMRIAAARICVQEEDLAALPALRENLKHADPAVRRQSATSLGALHDAQAVQPLVEALKAPADRFEEHAEIFALIQIGDTAPMIEALQSDVPNLRKAALIVLDQVPNASLTPEQFAPFLAETEESLRSTALWVASRHPEWSGVVLDFLRARLQQETDEDLSGVRALVLAYAAEAGLQQLLADLLALDSLSPARKLFLLDTLDLVALNPFPEVWVQRLGALAQAPQTDLQFRALALIQTRGIAAFDADLLKMAGDSTLAVPLRIAALRATAGRGGKLDDALVAFLLGELSQSDDAATRLSAAKALGQAGLDGGRLMVIANDVLPKAEAMTFSALLDLYRGGDDAAVGQALVASLRQADINPSLIPGGLDTLLASYPAPVLEAAAPLRAQLEAAEKERVNRLLKLEPMLNTGDVGRGRRVFFGDLANCHACHAVGEEGGRLGPDLTTIGTVRSPHDILEAVLFPSASFVPEYEPYRVTTTEDVYVGTIVRQTPDTITLGTGVNAEMLIPRVDIEAITPHSVSIMPEGLDVALSRQDLVDLVAFLKSLNKEPWLLPEQRGASEH